MSRATITDTGHPEVVLRTTRNLRFDDEFKRTIPRSARRFTGARWFVNRECLPRIEAIARRHFEHVEILEVP